MTFRDNHRICLSVLFALSVVLLAPRHLPGEWNLETIDQGRQGDIAIDSAGVVHVAYLDSPYGSDVAYAFRINDQWTATTLTDVNEIYEIAMAVDTSGAPHIIYTEGNLAEFNFDLQHITLTESGWSSPETILTGDADMRFWSPTIKMDRNNHIHITYLYTDADAGSGVIHYLTNSSGDWENHELNDKYQNPASNDVSMVVDQEGHVHIVSYFVSMGGPRYLTNAPDGQWSLLQRIQSNWGGGQLELLTIDVALDPDGNPHVSYVGSDNGETVENHRYATKVNNQWTSQQIDEGSWSSTGNAIASDLDGVEHIAYYHVESGELRYAMNYSGSWPHETIDTPEETLNNYHRCVDMVTDKNGFVHLVYESDDNLRYATTRVEIPAPNIVLNPTELTFGTIDTGQTSTKELQVKNQGVLDLHISDIKLTGGDSAEFSLKHLCDTIVPDDSCAVQVTFEPDNIGEKQTTVEIASDDPDAPVVTATITGRTPYPVILVDPVALEFEPQEVGESDTLDISIENTGDAELTIDSLRIIGGGADEFSYRSFCGTIAQSTSCVLEAIFTPGAVGDHSATLHIYSNDPYHSEVTVSLQGRTPSARIAIETDVLDFGSVPVGNLASAQLTIENTGTRQLNISSVTISGTDASLFRASNTCGVISSGGSCTIDLTFLPQSIGPKSALVSIASNDPDQPIYSIILQGTGGENQSRAYIYGTEGEQRFFCMDTLSSGGCVVGGMTGGGAYLAALSPEGDIVWQKEYTTGSHGDAIYAVRTLWDGGFVVGGRIDLGYRWIARLDSDGEILWQKKPDNDKVGNIYDIQITSDSGFIAVGEMWPLRTSDSDMWIGKFDSTGTLLWQKTIGNPGTDNFEYGTNILEVDGGDFIVASGSGSVTNPYSALIKHPDGGYLYGGNRTKLWKISATGSIIWQKDMDVFNAYDFALTRFSPGDAILWQYKYPLPESSIICDLITTSSGDILALGSIKQADNDDMRIMRLTKYGDIVWQKQFSAPGDQEGYRVLTPSEQLIAIAGFYDTEANDEEGWLCQLSSNGHLDGCASSSLVNTYATREAGGSNIWTISLSSQTPSGSFIDAEAGVSDASLTAQNLCTGVPLDVDYDGIDDTEEAGPDGQNANYDGNNDGLPDAQQVNVASLHSFDGTAYMTIATDPGIQLGNVSADDNPSPEDQPEEFDFPLGFFSFTLTGIDTGGSAVVDFILPEGSAPQTYYKYAHTADNAALHWYEFLYNDTTGAEITGNKISLHFTDGLLGDEDLAENASITDLGGPGIEAAFLVAPTLLQPENGATAVAQEPFYKWAPVDMAESYHLQVGLDERFSETVLNMDSLNTPSLHLLCCELQSNTTHYWRVRTRSQTDTSAWSEVWSFTTRVPQEYALHQNYPNPFGGETTIEFSLPEANRVRIELYDLRGNLCEVLTEQSYEAGDHKIVWTPKLYSNGIYFCRMKAGTFSDTKRLVILK